VPERNEIARILRDKVTHARKAYESAHTAFNTITADIPSGLPHPDGTDRIRFAGSTYRSTMNAYSEALHEFNVFISDGIIPERFKAAGKATEKETV
jgi:hypothetical protein